ncbi:MAG: class I SAM-dependent RNA methyltransferase [Treponema sp.]|nr:class I SAM-dependent RNA methyltransferase [Treponema sp.]
MVGELLKVQIESIATGGAGFARTGGKNIFIEGCLPGEVAVCRVTEEHSSWLRAELLEIDTASPDRVSPACSYYGACGGCNLQHLGYNAQLAAKAGILRESFARIGGITLPEFPVIPSEPWEYRNRMQFHAVKNFSKKGPAARLGMKARKKDEVIPVCDCPIADPGIRKFLKANSGGEQIPLCPPEKDRFNVYSRGPLFLSEGGIRRGKIQLLDKELAMDADVFFQSNGAMLEKLISSLKNTVGGGDQIKARAGPPMADLPMADLYCGVGTFASFLGEFFHHVDLVEENRAALALARENLAHLGSTAYFARRSEDWAKNSLSRSYGFIIVDPPRQGLDLALVSRLAKDGPPLLAYVSCNPAALARDSKALVLGKYRLEEISMFDFYPQTAHIESLALFSR